MVPLLLALISLSLSVVLPMVIAVFIWQRRLFLPEAAPWLVATNVFAGLEAVASLVALVSRDPTVVFWAEAALNFCTAVASWTFFMSMLALWPPGRHWLRLAGVVALLLALSTNLWGIALIFPRLADRDYAIYSLGDYPVIRFFVQMPREAEVLLFLAPGMVFTAGLVLAVLAYRTAFGQKRISPWTMGGLVLGAALIIYTHQLHLQGRGVFAAINPMPALEWLLALILAWTVLGQEGGVIAPFVGPAVLARAQEGVLVVDPQGRLVWWNRVAAQWMGAVKPLQVGISVPALLTAFPPLAEVLTHGDSHPREVQFRHPEKGEVFVEAYTLELYGRTGLRMGRALVFHDVTPWRRLQQEEAFRADAAHLIWSLLSLVLDDESLETSLTRAAALLRRTVGGWQATGVSLWLVDEDGQHLWRAAWHWPTTGRADGVSVDKAWWDPAVEVLTPAPQALTSGAKMASWAYPLRVEEQPLGMLVLEAEDPEVGERLREIWRSAAHTLSLLISRRRAAQRLFLMQQVYEHIQEAVLVFDALGFILDHNPAASRLLKRAHLRGHPGVEVLPLPPEQRKEMIRALDEQGRWFGLTEVEVDGQERIWALSAVQVGEVMGGLGIVVIRDVTERERLRQELEQQKAFLEHLLRIGQALLTTSLSVQETWRAVLRVGKELLQADNASLILVDPQYRVLDFFLEEEVALGPETADYWDMAQQVIDRGFAGEALKKGRVLLTQNTEKDPRWVFAETLPWKSAVAVPLFYQQQPLGVMTFSSMEKHHFRAEHLRLLNAAADMIALAVYNARLYEEQYALGQALLQAKEEAEDLRRRQEAFFANLSHEMRTPLQAILGYLEWLRMAEEGFLEYDEELRQIEIAAQRLLSIVNLVLEYRRSQEEDRLVVEPFALADVVDEVRSLVAPLARRNNNVLEVDLQPEDLTLTTDRQKVLHILLNLVSNAVKFTENGRVTVRARLEPGEDGQEGVRLEVEDTGIGIPENALPTIFEPFRQADGDAARRKGGTGLGLALVKRYTELLGGQVSVRSQEGQGTTFVVWLPRVLPQPQEEGV